MAAETVRAGQLRKINAPGYEYHGGLYVVLDKGWKGQWSVHMLFEHDESYYGDPVTWYEKTMEQDTVVSEPEEDAR